MIICIYNIMIIWKLKESMDLTIETQNESETIVDVFELKPSYPSLLQN